MKRTVALALLALFMVPSLAPAIVVTTGTERPSLYTQLGCPAPARVFPVAPVRAARIHGSISHQGESLPGVVVAACPAQGNVSVRVVTDVKGYFVTPPLPAGQYVFVVCLGGFDTATFELISPGSEPEAAVTLELPLSPIRLE